jgi:hypothetical protein
MTIRWTSRLITTLGLAVALLAVAGSAVAATGTIDIGSSATRVANGVAVDVPLTVSLTCDEGFTSAVVDVAVTQRRGQQTVFGQGQTVFPCDGETRDLVVRAGGGVFHGGRALATATLLQCQGEGQNLTCFFTDISTSEEILIRGG